MSNLEAPKFRKILAGEYVADMGNQYGHGLRATLDVCDKFSAIPGMWQLFVIDRQPGVDGGNDTLTVVHNGLHPTMISAKAFLNAKIADGSIRPNFAV